MENCLLPTKVASLAATHSVSSVSCGAFHCAAIATEVVENSADTTDVQVDIRDEDDMKLMRMDSDVFRETESSNRVNLLTW